MWEWVLGNPGQYLLGSSDLTFPLKVSLLNPASRASSFLWRTKTCGQCLLACLLQVTLTFCAMTPESPQGWSKHIEDKWKPHTNFPQGRCSLTSLCVPMRLFFFKSLLNLLQYCFCFMSWCFGHKACGISTFQLGAEPAPCALEGEFLTTGQPG